MNDSFPEIKETLLMGPGPSCVPPAVYEALSRPTIGHLDPRFISIMDEIKQMLQKLMQTSNRLTIPVSGTGSAGMEACFVNLVEPGDDILVLINTVGMVIGDIQGIKDESYWKTPDTMCQQWEDLKDDAREAGTSII